MKYVVKNIFNKKKIDSYTDLEEYNIFNEYQEKPKTTREVGSHQFFHYYSENVENEYKSKEQKEKSKIQPKFLWSFGWFLLLLLLFLLGLLVFLTYFFGKKTKEKKFRENKAQKDQEEKEYFIKKILSFISRIYFVIYNFFIHFFQQKKIKIYTNIPYEEKKKEDPKLFDYLIFALLLCFHCNINI